MTALFLNIVNRSIMAGFVILFLIPLRALLKKAPKIFSYCLWAAAFFRLSCPAVPRSGMSIFNLFSTLPASLYQSAGDSPAVLGAFSTKAEDLAGNALKTPAAQLFLHTAAFVWLAVALIIVGLGIRSTLLLKRRLRSSRTFPGRVQECAGLDAPFVYGIFKPVIYLPEGLTGQQRKYIICHENVHIKRKDPLIKLAAWLTLAAHWFNPLVWLAWHLMCLDMEMSCDEAVIRLLGDDSKKAYSHTLLSLAVKQSPGPMLPAAFCEGGAGRRIKNILRYHSPKKRTAALVFIIILAACAVLLPNPLKKDRPRSARQNCMTLNIREEPSFDGNIIGLTALDTRFCVLEQLDGGWCRVAFNPSTREPDDTDSGGWAYVRTEYLDFE